MPNATASPEHPACGPARRSLSDDDVRHLMRESAPFVIFDTEFTAWEGSMARGWSGVGEHRELVQIGAVRVQYVEGGARLEETVSLSVLARPRINPTLSEYFVRLTDISNGDLLLAGVESDAAIDRFLAFCAGAAAVVSNGGDENILLETAGLHGLAPRWPDIPFFDMRDAVIRHVGDGVFVSSGDVAEHLGVPLNGQAHDALFDARSLRVGLEHIARRLSFLR